LGNPQLLNEKEPHPAVPHGIFGTGHDLQSLRPHISQEAKFLLPTEGELLQLSVLLQDAATN
jgi:hypothetical protein